MSWLFSRQKANTNLPEPTALQSQRSKQIQQLKTYTQNISEIQRDVEYRVNISIPGSCISLYINLPPQFPQDKPVIRVAPPVQHPWVDANMKIIGCPEINDFVVNSNLGKAIESIIKEFTVRPPVVSFQQTYGGVGSMQTHHPVQTTPTLQPVLPQPPSYATYKSESTSRPAVPTLPYQYPPPLPAKVETTPAFHVDSQPQPTTGSYTMPEIPTVFPEFKNMSLEELQRLADDEVALLNIINELPQVKKIVLDRKELCSKNEELARENLPKQPILEEKKKTLLEKYDRLNELRTEFDHACSSQDHLRQQMDPSFIQDRLKVATMEAEDEAEVIAEQFLNGSITVDKFNTLYMEKRKLGYLRKAKEERLGGMIG